MEYAYDFGQTLRSLRKQKQMTQTQLGSRLGISKAAVCKYEQGVASPPLDILRTMAAIFNVSLDYLCGTEQREKISVYNLTNEQINIINRLTAVFRERNISSRSKTTEKEFLIMGEIVSQLCK